MEKDSSLPQPLRRTMPPREGQNIIQSSWLQSLWPKEKGLVFVCSLESSVSASKETQGCFCFLSDNRHFISKSLRHLMCMAGRNNV